MSFINSSLILCVCTCCVVHVGVRTGVCTCPLYVEAQGVWHVSSSTALCPFALVQGSYWTWNWAGRSVNPQNLPISASYSTGVSRVHKYPRFLCGCAEDLNLDPQASAASTLTQHAINPVPKTFVTEHEYFPKNITLESLREEKHLPNCMLPLSQRNDYLRYGNDIVSDNQQGPIGSSFLNTITTPSPSYYQQQMQNLYSMNNALYWIRVQRYIWKIAGSHPSFQLDLELFFFFFLIVTLLGSGFLLINSYVLN